MENWEKELRKKRTLDTLIINRPEALKKTRRRIEFSLTTIGWVVWIFLCRPLLLVVLWYLGFRFFFRHMVDLGGLAGLQELKYLYLSVIILIVFFVRGWNFYNKVRYGKKKRRKFAPPVSEKRLEEHFKLPQGSAGQLQGMNVINVEFLEDHQLRINEPGKSPKSFKGYFRPS